MNEKKKLTDEEIIKALECCAVEPCEDCGNCPRFTKEKLCHKANAKQSINLIHRLKSENERLKEVNAGLALANLCDLPPNEDCLTDNEFESARKTIAKQKAQIERLTEERDKQRNLYLNEWGSLANAMAKNAELKKQVDEFKERAKIDIANEKTWGKIQKEQAVKDTAKEIYYHIAKAYYDKEMLEIFRIYLKERYGVEVE